MLKEVRRGLANLHSHWRWHRRGGDQIAIGGRVHDCEACYRTVGRVLRNQITLRTVFRCDCNGIRLKEVMPR